MGTVGARFTENGKLVETPPSIDEARHRLAAVAGTSTCHIVQVSNLRVLDHLVIDSQILES